MPCIRDSDGRQARRRRLAPQGVVLDGARPVHERDDDAPDGDLHREAGVVKNDDLSLHLRGKIIGETFSMRLVSRSVDSCRYAYVIC